MITTTPWHHRDEVALTAADAPDNFLGNSALFRFKHKIASKRATANGAKNFEMMVPLKYLSNFWRTLEMYLINWENNLVLSWSKNVYYLMIKMQQHLK